MKRLLLILIFLSFCRLGYCIPNNTMSIAPAAADATTITAADENTRNSAISTPYNAHSHSDIGTVANTLNVGDATAGDKTINANNADVSKPYLQYDDTANVWLLSNDGSIESQIINAASSQTISGAKVFSGSETISASGALYVSGKQEVSGTYTNSGSELISGTLKIGTPQQGSVVYDNGNTITKLAPGTSGQVLVTGGAGANPSWGSSGMQYTDSRYYTGSFTYDVSTASGSQTITGLPFQSKFLDFTSAVTSDDMASIGYYDGTSNYDLIVSTTSMNNSKTSAFSYVDAANEANCNVIGVGTTNFMISCTKTNSPTGTATVRYKASR